MSTQMLAFINQEFMLAMEACCKLLHGRTLQIPVTGRLLRGALCCVILLPGMAMKSFLERLAARDELGRVGGRRSFRDLGMGETSVLSLSKGMRSPASPKRGVNKSLKKPAREPRKESISWPVLISMQAT
jgi:hypothetical protein